MTCSSVDLFGERETVFYLSDSRRLQALIMICWMFQVGLESETLSGLNGTELKPGDPGFLSLVALRVGSCRWYPATLRRSLYIIKYVMFYV